MSPGIWSPMVTELPKCWAIGVLQFVESGSPLFLGYVAWSDRSAPIIDGRIDLLRARAAEFNALKDGKLYFVTPCEIPGETPG